MNILYIIGNGFDLWHELPTSYSDFYIHAQALLDELENYYSFDSRQNYPWHDFENALGDFDPDLFFDFYNEVDVSSEDFRPKDIYGLEDEITEQANQHVANIQEAFFDWAANIDTSRAEKKISFYPGARFINFNYTPTLQSTYEISDTSVFHIHGSANRDKELIFGHGQRIYEPPELDENGDSNRDMFSDAQDNARYPLHALKKPVKQVLEKSEEYFKSLHDIGTVIIIGHSLSSIDLPYFQCVSVNANMAEWVVCSYTAEESASHRKALINCGIAKEKINTITYDDLQLFSENLLKQLNH